MDKRVIKPEVINSVSELTTPNTRHAYYMEALNGGYQLHRLTVQEDIVLKDEKIEDPDGWPEVMGYIEAEFSKEHFAR